jgi:hypothetical protein
MSNVNIKTNGKISIDSNLEKKTIQEKNRGFLVYMKVKEFALVTINKIEKVKKSFLGISFKEKTITRWNYKIQRLII